MKSEKDEPWNLDAFRVSIGAGMPYTLGGIRLLRKEFDITDQDFADLKAGKVLERRDPWDCKVVIEWLGSFTVPDEPEEDIHGPFMKVEK
jgi:hypothetical protein